MRIAICDDEKILTEAAARLVERWAEDRGVPCQLQTFSSGEELLFETAGTYPFDLLLLDIDLGGGRLSGLDLARHVRETDRRAAIAFLTNHPEHVFAGYEVAALRFLLKPVRESELFPLLDLVRASGERERRFLVLEAEGEQRRVEEDDILCLEARGHTVAVETVSGPVEVKTTLSALAKQLGPGFVSAHRSFLVNLRHVERVGRAACLLEGGRTVPVSRGAWAGLSRAFLDYYREV